MRVLLCYKNMTYHQKQSFPFQTWWTPLWESSPLCRKSEQSPLSLSLPLFESPDGKSPAWLARPVAHESDARNSLHRSQSGRLLQCDQIGRQTVSIYRYAIPLLTLFMTRFGAPLTVHHIHGNRWLDSTHPQQKTVYGTWEKVGTNLATLLTLQF